MTYSQALDFILTATTPGSILERKAMAEFMHVLGDVQDKVKYVHIAGTNGKGSTSEYVSSILWKAGYNSGLYISPYIQRFNERVQMNGSQIPDEELAAITGELAEATGAVMAKGVRRPTIFELITALGFVWFDRKGCDIAALEVGLGGRLDATNVIRCPECAVITHIGLDHTELLGDTLPLVAAEKCGIIKPGCDTVLYGQTEEVTEVVRRFCRERDSKLYIADASTAVVKSATLAGTRFDWGSHRDMEITLLGKHQVNNAVTALGVVDVLREKGWKIDEEAVREGLKAAKWPGRMELLHSAPTVIADGAHNPQGVGALMESMKALFPGRKFTFVMGMLADKDYETCIGLAAPLAERFYAVTPPSKRALPADALAQHLRAHGEMPIEVCGEMSHALERAMNDAAPGDVLCVFGSLYQIGEVRSWFGKESGE